MKTNNLLIGLHSIIAFCITFVTISLVINSNIPKVHVTSIALVGLMGVCGHLISIMHNCNIGKTTVKEID